MAEQRRRELAASARLAVETERWFFLDCLLAVIGFVGWVAGTAAAAALGAREAGRTLALGTASTQTLALLAGGVVAWIVLPALAATLRLRSRVTNVSGNVESHYRFDAPGTLLWPPVVVLAVSLAATIVSPIAWPAYAVAFVAGAQLLARTAAFSYRVFSFSRPGLVHAASFLTFSAYATAGVVQLGAVAGAGAMVRDAMAVLGVPTALFGVVDLGPVGVPALLAAGAVTPAVLVGAYLVCQSLAAAYVRWSEPTVDRGSLRAGQRNPFGQVAASAAGGRATATSQTRSSTTDSGEGRSVPVHIQTTRVYDPDDEVSDPAGIDTAHEGPVGQRCRTCNATFSPGTEIRFCPNCGQRLDDG
ncbi:hypothetical protein [Halomicrobium katesii]|uniref:hypothetical protein n=1 Tax=Halomicrobium katesii TaxID=437163 RepID=UPI000365059D|nr:hypothetical protein [Halomicrobium katesii]